MMTARLVADELGVSAATVLRWTRAGILPGFRLPSGALRYREEDLREWIGQRSTQEVGKPSVVEAPPAR